MTTVLNELNGQNELAARTKTKHYYSAHKVATRVSFGT